MAAAGSLCETDFNVDGRVLVHGLTSAAGADLNFRAGKIVKAEEAGRIGVKILGSKSPPSLLKRMNLLSASYRHDRELFLGLLTLHYSPGLRVARPALNAKLNEDTGLLLLIASFVTYPRACLFQFGGYMGKIWEENWCYADLSKPIALEPKPLPRLDAACSDMGLGRVLFAGGCGAHPRKCRFPDGFFKSAEVYDSITDEWYGISDMPTRRHGATACKLGDKVYVLGGMYVDERPVPAETKFCDVFDVFSATWSTLEASEYQHVSSVPFEEAAFFGAGAVDGRVVALLKGVTIAYNPDSQDGWRIVEAPLVEVGHSSCCTDFNGELIVASGRPTRYARSVAAFQFSTRATEAEWWKGSWRQLPDLNKARVGGSMCAVNGKLYITGGVDETSGDFCDDAERLKDEGGEWTLVPWFKMPRALHAQETFALPHLHQNNSSRSSLSRPTSGYDNSKPAVCSQA